MARCLRSSTPSSPTCAGSTLWAKSSSLCLVCMPYMYAYMYALYVCLFSVGQVFLFVAGMPRAFFFYMNACATTCVVVCKQVFWFQSLFFLSLYVSLYVSLCVWQSCSSSVSSSCPYMRPCLCPCMCPCMCLEMCPCMCPYVCVTSCSSSLSSSSSLGVCLCVYLHIIYI